MKNKSIRETNHLKLVNENIFVKALTDVFYPQKHFKNGKVKYYFWNEFGEYLFKLTKPFKSIPDASFMSYSVEIDVSEKDIILELGIKPMTKKEILWTIAELTRQQPKGEKGNLLTNGLSNIVGYLKCDDGVVRPVYVEWSSHCKTWDSTCDKDGSFWTVGDRIFVRK